LANSKSFHIEVVEECYPVAVTVDDGPAENDPDDGFDQAIGLRR
jgi:hypothetical protein